MAYHDGRERGDGTQAGEAGGVTGVQHEGDQPAHAGRHQAGVQGVATRKHQGGAVQDTCGKKKNTSMEAERNKHEVTIDMIRT